MQKFIFFTLLFSLALLNCYSQSKLLSLEENNGPEAYKFYPEYVRISIDMPQLQWRANSDAYTYVKNDILYEGNVKKGADKQIHDLVTINKNLIKAGLTELKRFPVITWKDENNFWYSEGGAIYLYDIKKGITKKVTCCNATAENASIEPNTMAVAYTSDNNLYVSIGTEEEIAITNENDKNIVNGQTVSRHEFNINTGIFWSPKGNFLAYYKKDESQVTEYPLIDISKTPATVKLIKYPMAGSKSEFVNVCVFDMKTRKNITLKTGEKTEQYLTNLCWSADEKYIYITILNRQQNHLKLNQYDAISGELIKTLFEEKSQKYIEPENTPVFFTTKSNEFLWFSEKNGYKHLYLYNTNGELIEQITDGKFDVLNIISIDPTEQFVYYIAVDEDYPLQQSLYSINLQTKEIVKLSTSDGVHEAIISPTKKYFFDMFSSNKIPHQIQLIDATGLVIKTIYNAPNPLADYKTGEITVGTIAADDKTELYYRMIKPINFDPTKKYPVIVYVYGGPHAQMISNIWLYGASMWQLYMAQQGFIVFTVDNRGSANRGLKFEQAIHKNISTTEIKDQMAGIEFLTNQSFVDASRIGVHGWSYGGYMTTALMLKQNETFKVGVAGAPVIDWSMYEVMYGERYMSTPTDNPEGYKNANLLNFATNLKGKLLLIHGTSDDTVVLQHTLKFINECNLNNVQVEYYQYPGHSHAVRGKSRLHLDTKISKYFIENL